MRNYVRSNLDAFLSLSLSLSLFPPQRARKPTTETDPESGNAINIIRRYERQKQ